MKTRTLVAAVVVLLTLTASSFADLIDYDNGPINGTVDA